MVKILCVLNSSTEKPLAYFIFNAVPFSDWTDFLDGSFLHETISRAKNIRRRFFKILVLAMPKVILFQVLREALKRNVYFCNEFWFGYATKKMISRQHCSLGTRSGGLCQLKGNRVRGFTNLDFSLTMVNMAICMS